MGGDCDCGGEESVEVFWVLMGNNVVHMMMMMMWCAVGQLRRRLQR